MAHNRDAYRPSYDRGGPGTYDAPRSSRGYDDYSRRPPPPPPDYYQPPPPSRGNNDMFHFGAGGGDSYRPRNSREAERGDSHRAPSGNTSERPVDAAAQRWLDSKPSKFDFRSDAGLQAPSFHNSVPQSRNSRRGQRPAHGAESRRGRGGRGRAGFNRPSDRALFRARRSPTPEQLDGMNGGHSRFKVLEDMSGSESEEMDLGTPDSNADVTSRSATVPWHNAEDSDEDEHPRSKRARVGSPKQVAAADSKPMWSNPDPYTALPPPGESQAKRKDVVKLIRKAKVEDSGNTDGKAAAADFISLNFDDPAEDGQTSSASDDDSHDEAGGPSQAAPFSHLNQLHPDRTTAPLPTASRTKLDVWPPPAEDGSARNDMGTALERQEAGAPATKAVRNRVDKKRKRRDRSPNVGEVSEIWDAQDEFVDLTPWRQGDHRHGGEGNIWLHQEIVDFYDYVRPHDFEEAVRRALIRRIQAAVSYSYPHAEIKAFGSFESSLYLPTADMDLVAVTQSFLKYGARSLCLTYHQMRKFSNELERAGLVRPGTLTVIANARVPIVKFVERETGLRVDISFENDSGLIANDTFAAWRVRYPAMPFIVALVKQFLAMRDLSEVFTGGLGGYSTICLVVCTIHFLEQQHHQYDPSWEARNNLDKVLLTFLEHYGTRFNINSSGLDMKKMVYVNKGSFDGKPSKAERLLIIDPNNSTNDISGGSANVPLIFRCFRDAFESLTARMDDVEREEYNVSIYRSSILGCVWGGNYESFEIQRNRLKRLFDTNYSEYALSGSSGNGPGAGARAVMSANRPSLLQQNQGRPDNVAPVGAAVGGKSSKANNIKSKKQDKQGAANPPPKADDPNATMTAKKPKKPKKPRTPKILSQPEQNVEAAKPHKVLTRAVARKNAAGTSASKEDAATVVHQKSTGTLKSTEDAAKERKAHKLQKAGDVSRAKSFKDRYPGIEAPRSMSKAEYKKRIAALAA